MIITTHNNVKFVFLGATKFSLEILEFLISLGYKPEAIFTIPKEFKISYSSKRVTNVMFADLKKIAFEFGISHYEVDSVEGKRLKDYEYVFRSISPDFILAIGWYYMVPKQIRNLAKLGAWGIHASLLPKYAGGAPLVWAIINGEKETGVTLFRFEDGVDDGDIIAQRSFPIDENDTINEVYKKAIDASKEILKIVLKDVRNVRFTPQDKSKIEIYPQRSPDDGRINWNQSAKRIYDFIRAQTLPYPCAFSFVDGKKVKIINSKLTDIDSSSYECGQIVKLSDKTLVATKDKFLYLGVVDDGTKRLEFETYANIYNLYGKIFES